MPNYSLNIYVLILTSFIITCTSCSKDEDPPPTAAFQFTSSKSLPATVQFTNLTTAGTGSAYAWEFGDGSISTATHPSHAYTAVGTYQVKLTHTPQSGSPEIITKQVVISTTGPSGTSHKPENSQAADFSFTITYGVPYFVTFTNKSVNATSYYWDFDDNSISQSTATTVTHTFNTAGPYYVVLSATNDKGTDTSGVLISF